MNCVFEQLESRRLLTVTLVNGIAYVVGTDGDDTITASRSENGVQLVITMNGVDTVYPRGTVERIDLYGKKGNDSIDVDDPEGQVGVYMSGGSGDDTLIGGNGNDTLKGGAGEDSILGNAGQDSLSGGPDDDYLFGGAGADNIWGGKGFDTFQEDPNAVNEDFGVI